MARTKEPQFHLKPLIDLVGMHEVIRQVGLQRVVDEIGLEQFIKQAGKKKVVNQLLEILTSAEREDLKRKLAAKE